MKEMSLAEAFLTLQEQEEKLMKLKTERRESRVNVYRIVNGEEQLEHEEHERTMDLIIKDINNTMRNIRKLRVSIALGNITTDDNKDVVVDFKDEETGEKICLQEALILIKQLRNEAEHAEALSNLKTTKKLVNPLGGYEVDESCYEQVTRPNFNTKAMRKIYNKYCAMIKKLELSINQCNYNTLIEVDFIESELE